MKKAHPLDRIMSASEERNKTWSPPELFNLNVPEDVSMLERAYAGGRVYNTHNAIGTIARNLFELHHPGGTKDEQQEYIQQDIFQDRKYGRWVLYPWSGDLVRFPEEMHYFLMRTDRFRNLLTKEQLLKLHEKHVLLGGQSIGSEATLAFIKNLGVGEITIGDKAEPNVSGIGRSAIDMRDMGMPKVDATAKRISYLDPFMKQHHLQEGVSKKILNSLETVPSIVVDEVDDMESSAEMREYSRRHKLPYLTVSDVDDTVVLEVNRFDTNPALPLYAGKISEKEASALLQKTMSEGDQQDVFARSVGYKNLTPPLIQSTLQIGNEVAGIPQKGSTALVAAGVATTACREILLGNRLNTGIYSVPVGKIVGKRFTAEEWFEAASAYYRHVQQSKKKKK